ncbi:CvpA family protein [Clostridium sp. DL1XJH146]
MNNVDFVIIAIVIIAGIIGYIKGFWLSLISLAKYLVAMIGTKIFSPIVTDFLWNSSFKDTINNYIIERFQTMTIDTLGIDPSNLELSGDLFSNSDSIGGFFSNSIAYMQNLLNSNILKVGQSISSAFTALVISSLGILITFLGLLLILTIVTSIVNKSIKKSKKFSFINNSLGFLFNAFSSIIVIVILLIVSGPIIYSSSNSDIFSQSLILNFFYTSKIYAYLITNLMNVIKI